jgi:hypothetical protein
MCIVCIEYIVAHIGSLVDPGWLRSAHIGSGCIWVSKYFDRFARGWFRLVQKGSERSSLFSCVFKSEPERFRYVQIGSDDSE